MHEWVGYMFLKLCQSGLQRAVAIAKEKNPSRQLKLRMVNTESQGLSSAAALQPNQQLQFILDSTLLERTAKPCPQTSLTEPVERSEAPWPANLLLLATYQQGWPSRTSPLHVPAPAGLVGAAVIPAILGASDPVSSILPQLHLDSR